jgi:single-stranded DNA-binding protein
VNGLHCAATGRVTFEPEQRFTSTGMALVTFSIVGDQGHTVATEAKAAPPPIYLRVTAWEPSEELLDQLQKGASVYVEGKLTRGTWTGQDSAPRCGLNLSAWRVDVHGAIGKRAPQRVNSIPHDSPVHRRAQGAPAAETADPIAEGNSTTSPSTYDSDTYR